MDISLNQHFNFYQPQSLAPILKFFTLGFLQLIRPNQKLSKIFGTTQKKFSPFFIIISYHNFVKSYVPVMLWLVKVVKGEKKIKVEIIQQTLYRLLYLFNASRRPQTPKKNIALLWKQTYLFIALFQKLQLCFAKVRVFEQIKHLMI